MNTQRVVGTILLLIGVALFVVGMNASGSVVERWSDFFTGHFTETTVWTIIGGVASAIGGLMLVLFGGRKALA